MLSHNDEKIGNTENGLTPLNGWFYDQLRKCVVSLTNLSNFTQGLTRVLSTPNLSSESDSTDFSQAHIEHRPENSSRSNASTSNLESLKNGWIRYKDLEINEPLYERGVTVIKAFTTGVSNLEDTKNTELSFMLCNREFHFSTNDTLEPNIHRHESPFLTPLREICGASINTKKNGIIIYNKQHRDDTFSPLIIEDPKSNKIAFYVMPWISKGLPNSTPLKKIQAAFNITKSKDGGVTQFCSKITRFVTAECLFGPSITAENQKGRYFLLIKHDIEFYENEKIIRIHYNPLDSAYEETQLQEFEKLTLLMKRLTKPNHPTELFFHSPHYDYMLFVLKLYVDNRITYEALEDFFRITLEKQKEIRAKIENLCSTSSIKVTIESPFENVFGDLKYEHPDTTLANHILSTTIPHRDFKTEKELVEFILNKLKHNNYNKVHQTVWNDFISIEATQEIDSIEKLFKLSNAVMIGRTSLGQGDCETCSLLPLSEKEIQRSYAKTSANFSKKGKSASEKYPTILNLTLLDPIIPDVPDQKKKTTGLFYFRNSQNTLTKIVKDKKVLEFSHQNAARFQFGQEPISLNDVLKKKFLK